ncbi:MAG: tryptophan synthase subunit alpha [Candidatus Omnitrophica bacterium]|nr:tryptophan synthase subunit alpha [Candidatus Omnitrophota bacterium]
MNRIDKKFEELRAQKRKAFIAFVTAGYPSLKETEELVLAIERSGADIIELGVPFSDPLADGPTIQEASYQALLKGVTLKKILETVRVIRACSEIPIALMTYYNPVFRFGEKKFVEAANNAGVDGVIIPDLPVEEAGVLMHWASKSDLATIFFLAPTTEKDRMPGIVKASTGFIYFVSVAGVTGSKKSLPFEIEKNIRMAKGMTDKPVCVGFGISTPEDVKVLGSVADGVIVGSAIVKEIGKNTGRPDMVERVAGFVKQLADAL